MKLYRINKVASLGGPVIKKRDVLARSDRDAMETARDSSDCPVCEVFRDGAPVGIVA